MKKTIETKLDTFRAKGGCLVVGNAFCLLLHDGFSILFMIDSRIDRERGKRACRESPMVCVQVKMGSTGGDRGFESHRGKRACREAPMVSVRSPHDLYYETELSGV